MGRSRLLDQMREILRMHHYSIRTEEAYLEWVKRYIFFHNKRHPSDMGENEVSAFLTCLAVNKHVSASTKIKRFQRFYFIWTGVEYTTGLARGCGQGKTSERVARCFTRSEVMRILYSMTGINAIIDRLLYGTGMCLMEGLRLRVQDVDF